jgi:hypothetical protein
LLFRTSCSNCDSSSSYCYDDNICDNDKMQQCPFTFDGNNTNGNSTLYFLIQ